MVRGRDPLWEGFDEGPAFETGHLTPRTSVLDGELERAIELPHENAFTLVLSVALLLLFGGLLIRVYWLAGLGGVLTLGSLARWLWPHPRKIEATEA
jgi:hypothetical protein